MTNYHIIFCPRIPYDVAIATIIHHFLDRTMNASIMAPTDTGDSSSIYSNNMIVIGEHWPELISRKKGIREKTVITSSDIIRYRSNDISSEEKVPFSLESFKKFLKYYSYASQRLVDSFFNMNSLLFEHIINSFGSSIEEDNKFDFVNYFTRIWMCNFCDNRDDILIELKAIRTHDRP